MTDTLDEAEFMDNFAQEENGGIDYISSPEYKLMAAVLERSILDLATSPALYGDEVLDWLNEKIIDDPYIYSFQSICSSLDLDLNLVKSKVLARAGMLREEKLKARNSSRQD